LQNACGTQAVLSIVLNRPDIEIGPQLEEFKEFTAAFPPDLRGEALSNSGAPPLSRNLRRSHSYDT
jgi:ubiquitin carboxyl-terminal hydrolase L5